MIVNLLAVSIPLLASNPSLFADEKVKQKGWRFEIEEGQTIRDDLALRNRCKEPHVWRIKSQIKYLRFEQPTDEILIPANETKLIGMAFDATGLKSKVYNDKFIVECLDCKKGKGCHQDRSELPIEMTVIKRTSVKKEEPTADQKPSNPQRHAVLRKELVQAVEKAREQLRAGERKLKPIEVPDRVSGETFPDGPRVKLAKSLISSASVAFDAQEVTRVIESAKDSLTRSLTQKEFLGLRDYIQRFFPRTKDYPVIPSSPTLISSATKTRLFQDAYDLISRVERVSNKLSINLVVRSEPTQAVFEIWPEAGGIRTTTTESTIQNLYRGYYRYKVSKAGFKSIETVINLIDEDGSSFECRLHRLDEKDGPYPCSLK